MRPRYSRSPLGQPAREVARAVEPRSRLDAAGIGDEALGGQVRPPEVAAGEAGAADAELPRHPDRHRLPAAVEQMDAVIGDRPADRRQRRPAVRRPVQEERGGDVGLGRPVLVEQPGAALEERRHRRGDPELLAGGDQLAQGRRRPPLLAGDPRRAAGARRRAGRAARSASRPGSESSAAGSRRSSSGISTSVPPEPQVENSSSKETSKPSGENWRTRRPRSGRDLAGPGGQVGQRPMRQRHALGAAGGAGGVEDVGEVLGARPGRRRGRRLAATRARRRSPPADRGRRPRRRPAARAADRRAPPPRRGRAGGAASPIINARRSAG